MSRPNYYRSPQQLLDDLGIGQPTEIDVEVIAFKCGAIVRYEPLTGCEARIVGTNDKARIVVNSYSSRPRQRFSVGHELGHWMRDRGKVAFSCDDLKLTTQWTERNPEALANEYASDLLLPSGMFKPRARNRPIFFETVRDLAEEFRTSLTATAIRLVTRGPFPAMLVCYSSTGREWFVRGPDIPGMIWPRDMPGKDTIAHDLLHGIPAGSGPIDTYADQWITRSGSERYSLREDSVCVSGDSILSLLWWKDETQLLDIEEEEERYAGRRSGGRDD